LYREKVGAAADPTQAEGLLSDAYADILGTDGVLAARTFVEANPFVLQQIKDRARSKLIFRQPSILLAYMAVSAIPNEAAAKWPLTPSELKPIYVDLGQALPTG
jgi:hypothetical protein